MGEICIANFCCNHADRERSGPQEVLRHLHLFCHNKIFELDPHLLFKKAREVVRIQIEFFCDLGAPDIPLDMVLDILDDLLHLAFGVFFGVGVRLECAESMRHPVFYIVNRQVGVQGTLE